MTGWALVCLVTVAVLTVLRFVAALCYLRAASRDGHCAPASAEVTASPRISIFMPVRGVDPHLPRAIRSLLDQDYENFEVRIIVDSSQDPAWEIVRRVVDEAACDRVTVSELHQRRSTCSLVCNALLQFLDEVGDTSELVAFCASDMVVARNWIREMAFAMSDRRVGSTLGNRWYMPPAGQWGSLVRYLWNVSAVVQMWLHGVPWGGTVCLRVADLRRAGLPELWAHSMIEDIPIRQAMSRIGLRLKFVPELLVVNREETGLPECVRFLTRQLFWATVYSSNRWQLLALIGLIGLTTLGSVALVPIGIVERQPQVAMCGATAIVFQVGLMLLSAGLIERHVRRMMIGRNEAATKWPISARLKLSVAIVLAQILAMYAAAVACFTRELRWRGVRYRVDGPFQVQLIEDDKVSTTSMRN